jgi:lipooligosaccharide transport system ATP-binding protein
MNKLIEVSNIFKKYNDIMAVDDVSFFAKKGECLGLLGPNGAGKTTIVKMLHNLVKRDKGSVKILGYDPKFNEVEVKYRLGIVPQEDNLDPDLNVIENLEIYANYFGIHSKRAKNKIDELLGFFDLTDKRNNKIQQLSGGMKRRLVIIRSLLNNPSILFLDEPTTGLDPQARHLIWDKLRELKTNNSLTIILTTHYMEEASQLCDRLMILNKGKLIIEGNPHKLLEENFENFVLETENFNIDFDLQDIRHEFHGNRIFFYSNEQDKLFSLKECVGSKSIILRNSTLEDLFLKLTGRQLNE